MTGDVVPALQQARHRLADAHDVALLDLDGVVYIGPDAVPGAPQVLAAARRAGMRLAFVTNNAARPPHVVADHLTELGVDASADEVITSAQAAARYLADHLPDGAHVLVIGTTGLHEALRERGLVPVSDADGTVAAVVQGYSPTLDWALLAEGAVALNTGVPWVATNVDPTVPSPRGPLPGNGSLVAALAHATGRDPVVTGKPDPTMHRETLIRTGAQRPLVVGDRLDTDIEGANAVGCPSLLVFSGVTEPVDLLGAGRRHRPTFLAADLRGVLSAHPAPRKTDGGWRCGRWVAGVSDSGLTLHDVAQRDAPSGDGDAGEVDAGNGSGDGRRRLAEPDDAANSAGMTPPRFDDDALDALRALCAAAWSARPERDGADGASAPVRTGSAAAAEVAASLGLRHEPGSD